MKITLLHSAQNEKIAEVSAAICVDRLDNPTRKGMMTALSSGHLSIIEHLPLTFLVEDVSRALTHQLVRHRICSFSQMSQRYAKVKTRGKKWFITPMSIAAHRIEGSYTLDRKYQNLMVHIAELYNELQEAGIPNEDARMILPNACFTSIIVSMNARSFIEAGQKRICKKAQWEIREMFRQMRELIKDIYPTVYELTKPNCLTTGCTEAKPCGNPYEKLSNNK